MEISDPLILRYKRYLESRRRSPNTVRQRLVYVGQVRQELGDLLALTPMVLGNFVDDQSAKWAPETINACVSSIRSFYKWALIQELIERDPSRHLELVRFNRAEARIASDRSVTDALVGASLEHSAWILLARLCGLRRMEIASLRIEDRAGDWLRVLGKGQKIRRVYIQPELAEVLTRVQGDRTAGYYFPGRFGGHITTSTVYETIRRLVGTNTHSLRHASATAVFNATKDIRVTQEFLGHASIMTTARYVHVASDAMVAASVAASLSKVSV